MAKVLVSPRNLLRVQLWPFLALAVLICSSKSAVGQEFSVTGSTPAPGDSMVSSQTTISFTFSQPVDTSARLDGHGPLAFYKMGGDSLTIDSSYVGEDLTRFSFDVTHHDTTDFVWILSGAASADGEMLCDAYALTYTTRSGWGEGMVQGYVEYIVAVKSGACGRGVAALLNAVPDSSADVALAVSVQEDAGFKIEGVRMGSYWPISFLDYNRDGLFKPDWGNAGQVHSEIGIYDHDHDHKADSVAVTDSTRVDIQILATGGSTEGSELPGTARLLQSFPNPFDRQLTLAFELERPMRIALTVHDVLGRRVGAPASAFFPAGYYEIAWIPRYLASGLYVIRLSGKDFTLMRTATRVKR